MLRMVPLPSDATLGEVAYRKAVVMDKFLFMLVRRPYRQPNANVWSDILKVQSQKAQKSDRIEIKIRKEKGK